MHYGIECLSDRELLAILIRHGNKQISSLDIADEILKISSGIGKLVSLSIHDLIKVKGIQKTKALELLACFEVAKRMCFEETLNQDVIKDPYSLIQWLNLKMGMLDQEQFMVIFLNVRNQIIHHEVLFKGTVDHSLVHPREVFKQALLHSCSRFMIVHNHPSGHLEPSSEDLLITDQFAEIGKLMRIELLDHLIIGHGRSFSFKQAGLLD